MNAMRAAVSGLLFTVAAALIGPAPVRAADAVLYEVTEAVRLGKNGSFKSSKATLSGVAAPGTALCPEWLATQLAVDTCTITVNAVGKADDATGFGPVTGSFDVLMQDYNNIDMPEIVIMRGTLSGTLDLSPAFVEKKPRGSITGEFHGNGVVGTAMAGQRARGRFDGTFRIPFRHNGKASYLLDDGSIVLVSPGEFILGTAMVRVELTFTDESLLATGKKQQTGGGDEAAKGTTGQDTPEADANGAKDAKKDKK